MAKTFWQKLKKPFFCLAPMSGVTDFVFREIISETGKPDLFFTEFVSCDGICSKGKEKLMPILKFSQKQRPIIAQFFGKNPENFYKCALLAKKLKFDAVDINMGCPDRSVIKQEAGSSLIKNPELAKEIILAVKKGSGGLPVSVKTRIGWDKDEVDSWILFLLNLNLDAISIHARTKKQGYRGKADWKAIKKAADIRNKLNRKTLIIGNGDIKDLSQARKMAEFSGVDGIMIGREILNNPWLFSGRKKEDVSVGEKIKVLKKHLNLFEKNYGRSKPFCEIKKYFKSYLSGFPGAKELRIELMNINSFQEAKNILESF